MLKRPILTLLVLVATCLACKVPCVLAHTQVSSARLDFKALIKLEAQVITIECTVTLNRPGAYLEVLKMDTDQDGELSGPEQASYLEKIRRLIMAGIEVKLNGAMAALEPVGDVKLAMPFTKLLRFRVDQPAEWRRGATLEFHNDCFLEYQGSVTTIVDPGVGANIVYNSQWDLSRDDELVVQSNVTTDAQQRDLVIRYRTGTDLSRLDDQGPGELRGDISDRIGIRQPPRQEILSVGIFGLVVIVVVVLAVLHRPRSRFCQSPVVRLTTIVLLVGVAAALLLLFQSNWKGPVVPDQTEAVEIFRKLHSNIYAAFKATTESEIYDVLAGSLGEELLDELYNEVHAAVISRSGGASFNIRRVKPLQSELLPAPATEGAAYRVRHHWRVYGTVSHFGHRHSRINEYRAVYTVTTKRGLWRITDVWIEQQQRIDPVSSI